MVLPARGDPCQVGRNAPGPAALAPPEVKDKKPQPQYILSDLYQDCGFLSLILQCTKLHTRIAYASRRRS
eukprot:850331-Rhodomonas_salina.1